MTKRLIFIVLLILLITQAIFAQTLTEYYTHLKPEHREVLKKWLAKKTGLHPAVEADASKDDLEAWRRDNKSFFPYYAVGDFNQDGKEDFAVFLKIEAKGDSALAIFNAPFKSAEPAYFKKGFSGVESLYIEYKDEEKMLYVTKYETHGFYLKAKGRKYVRDKSLDKYYQ